MASLEQVVNKLNRLVVTAIVTAFLAAGTALGQGEVNLTVSVWTSDEAHLALLNEIAEDYMVENPQVGGITFQSVPFDTYDTRLVTQLAGGDAPDLGWLISDQAGALIGAEALYDVGPTFRDDPDYAFEDIIPTTLSAWTRDDALYGYQFSTSPDMLFYNADVFAEAGVETPLELLEVGEWTWDNLATTAQTLVDAGAAQHGLVIVGFDYQVWQTLAVVFNGYGAEAFPEGNTCGFDSPEMVEALSLFHRMIFQDGSYPLPGQSADFPSGGVAMQTAKVSAVNLLADAPFAWDVVPLPSGPAGFRPSAGASGIVVFASGSNPEVAADFMKFWTNEANTRQMAEFFPPPRAALLQPEVLAEANPLMSSEQLERALIGSVVMIPPITYPENHAQLVTTVRPLLDSLWQPNADVATVLANVCQSVEPLLAAQ